MIRMAEAVEYLESRKVPLDPRHKSVVIEVASNRPIDVAVVDDDQMKAFEASETGEDVPIDWTANTRNTQFDYDLSDRKKRFLLFWNAHEENDAVIAYKITPIE